jgi:hypothetical protein
VNAYFNPERQFASRGDTTAFPRPPELAARSSAQSSAGTALGAGGGVLPERVSSVASALSTREDAVAACNPDPVTLCLGDGRFAITIDWKDFRGRVGVGHSHALNGTTGYFRFFDEENVEIAIKVLDGRALNGHFWVFYGALSNVEYTIRVEDTVTGAARSYLNPLHRFASRGDTVAFADP